MTFSSSVPDLGETSDYFEDNSDISSTYSDEYQDFIQESHHILTDQDEIVSTMDQEDMLKYLKDFGGSMDILESILAKDLQVPEDKIEEKEPIDFFKLIIPDDFFDSMLKETKTYGLEKNIKALKKGKSSTKRDATLLTLDSKKLQAFVGVALLMSHRQRSSIDAYWQSSWPYEDPVIAKVFTKNEFKFPFK